MSATARTDILAVWLVYFCDQLLHGLTLLALQIYQPSEIEYQYHMTEGCTVDGKVFSKFYSLRVVYIYIIHVYK